MVSYRMSNLLGGPTRERLVQGRRAGQPDAIANQRPRPRRGSGRSPIMAHPLRRSETRTFPRLSLGRADEYRMSETRLRSQETRTEGKVQAPFFVTDPRKSRAPTGAIRPCAPRASLGYGGLNPELMDALQREAFDYFVH